MTEIDEGRVLLVDDEKDFLDVLSQRLEVHGYIVETAESGPETLELLKKKTYDAIVLDLSMPGMDGMETLKKVKASRPDMQIIILTGYGTIEAGIEAMKAGASDFVEKPVDIKVLIEKITVAQEKHEELEDKKQKSEVKKILTSRGW